MTSIVTFSVESGHPEIQIIVHATFWETSWSMQLLSLQSVPECKIKNKNCTITGHPRIFLRYEEFVIPCDSDVTEPKSNQNEPRVPYVGVNS